MPTTALNERKTLCTYRILKNGNQVGGKDIGNGLIRNNKLTGIFSSEGTNKTPPIYLRISEYIRWIQKAIRE